MNECPICGQKHPETPEECGQRMKLLIHNQLAATFDTLLLSTADTKYTRMMICDYTLGYMGAQYGLHIT